MNQRRPVLGRRGGVEPDSTAISMSDRREQGAVASTLVQFVDAARARVGDAIERHLPTPPACPPLLCDAIRYSVLAGGKRLRPLLTLAAAETVGRLTQEADADRLAMPAACAVEFMHTYSLIHDDLPAMDDDTLRRGRPTVHVVYGDGIAILAGDALQAHAFALLVREPVDDRPAVVSRKLAAISRLAEAAGPSGMVGGQVIDLQAAGQVPGHELMLGGDGLAEMHRRKTGALIRAAAACGAIMAGADPTTLAAVERWASDVGLAFQIVDDILDVEGTSAELGKTVGKDAAGRKPTYPALYGLERARAMAAECRDRARGILLDAHLTDGWLEALADWAVTRRT